MGFIFYGSVDFILFCKYTARLTRFLESNMFNKHLILAAIIASMSLNAVAEEKEASVKAKKSDSKESIHVKVQEVNPIPVPSSLPASTVAPLEPLKDIIPPTALVTKETENKFEKIAKEIELDEKTKLNNEAIRKLFNVFTEAINNRDNEKFKQVIREQLIVINNNQELLSNKKTVEEYFPAVLGKEHKMERTSFSIEDGAVVEISDADNKGNVYGRGVEKYNIGTVEHLVPIRWSASVVKENEDWKINSFHIGTNVIDNPIVSSFEAFGWKMGVVGGFIGIIIGFLFGTLVSRSKKE